MSDPTRQEFLDFLTSKKTAINCEVCGSNAWLVPDADKGMLVAIPVHQPNGFVLPPPAVPTALAVCGNCGNVRFHALAVVKPTKP